MTQIFAWHDEAELFLIKMTHVGRNNPDIYAVYSIGAVRDLQLDISHFYKHTM